MTESTGGITTGTSGRYRPKMLPSALLDSTPALANLMQAPNKQKASVRKTTVPGLAGFQLAHRQPFVLARPQVHHLQGHEVSKV